MAERERGASLLAYLTEFPRVSTLSDESVEQREARSSSGWDISDEVQDFRTLVTWDFIAKLLGAILQLDTGFAKINIRRFHIGVPDDGHDPGERFTASQEVRDECCAKIMELYVGDPNASAKGSNDLRGIATSPFG